MSYDYLDWYPEEALLLKSNSMKTLDLESFGMVKKQQVNKGKNFLKYKDWSLRYKTENERHKV